MPSPRRVLIVNSNEDVVEMLRLKFETHGWEARTAHVVDAKRDRIDLAGFTAEHDPAIIVYDVAPPYDENWKFLQGLLQHEAFQGRAFVLTTTNKAQLEKICGGCDAIEIVGKPFDLEAILATAERSTAAHR